MGVHVIDYNVDMAIIKEVAISHPACRSHFCKTGSLNRWNQGELSILVMEEQRSLGPGGAPVLVIDPWVNMPVHNEEIEPAVIVVVEERSAPTEKWNGNLGDPGLERDIGEVRIAIIPVERVVVVGKGRV